MTGQHVNTIASNRSAQLNKSTQGIPEQATKITDIGELLDELQISQSQKEISQKVFNRQDALDRQNALGGNKVTPDPLLSDASGSAEDKYKSISFLDSHYSNIFPFNTMDTYRGKEVEPSNMSVLGEGKEGSATVVGSSVSLHQVYSDPATTNLTVPKQEDVPSQEELVLERSPEKPGRWNSRLFEDSKKDLDEASKKNLDEFDTFVSSQQSLWSEMTGPLQTASNSSEVQSEESKSTFDFPGISRFVGSVAQNILEVQSVPLDALKPNIPVLSQDEIDYFEGRGEFDYQNVPVQSGQVQSSSKELSKKLEDKTRLFPQKESSEQTTKLLAVPTFYSGQKFPERTEEDMQPFFTLEGEDVTTVMKTPSVLADQPIIASTSMDIQAAGHSSVKSDVDSRNKAIHALRAAIAPWCGEGIYIESKIFQIAQEVIQCESCLLSIVPFESALSDKDRELDRSEEEELTILIKEASSRLCNMQSYLQELKTFLTDDLWNSHFLEKVSLIFPEIQERFLQVSTVYATLKERILAKKRHLSGTSGEDTSLVITNFKIEFFKLTSTCFEICPHFIVSVVENTKVALRELRDVFSKGGVSLSPSPIISGTVCCASVLKELAHISEDTEVADLIRLGNKVRLIANSADFTNNAQNFPQVDYKRTIMQNIQDLVLLNRKVPHVSDDVPSRHSYRIVKTAKPLYHQRNYDSIMQGLESPGFSFSMLPISDEEYDKSVDALLTRLCDDSEIELKDFSVLSDPRCVFFDIRARLHVLYTREKFYEKCWQKFRLLKDNASLKNILTFYYYFDFLEVFCSAQPEYFDDLLEHWPNKNISDPREAIMAHLISLKNCVREHLAWVESSSEMLVLFQHLVSEIVVMMNNPESFYAIPKEDLECVLKYNFKFRTPSDDSYTAEWIYRLISSAISTLDEFLKNSSDKRSFGFRGPLREHVSALVALMSTPRTNRIIQKYSLDSLEVLLARLKSKHPVVLVSNTDLSLLHSINSQLDFFIRYRLYYSGRYSVDLVKKRVVEMFSAIDVLRNEYNYYVPNESVHPHTNEVDLEVDRRDAFFRDMLEQLNGLKGRVYACVYSLNKMAIMKETPVYQRFSYFIETITNFFKYVFLGYRGAWHYTIEDYMKASLAVVQESLRDFEGFMKDKQQDLEKAQLIQDEKERKETVNKILTDWNLFTLVQSSQKDWERSIAAKMKEHRIAAHTSGHTQD